MLKDLKYALDYMDYDSDDDGGFAFRTVQAGVIREAIAGNGPVDPAIQSALLNYIYNGLAPAAVYNIVVEPPVPESPSPESDGDSTEATERRNTRGRSSD
jgi:hypothetical protein